MNAAQLPPFLQALFKPEVYPHPVSDLQLIQTHISYVILAGDFVYKFKKPVDFGFLDFSDLDKRLFCCEQELLLNRRLCPEIYLGLVRVTDEGKGRWALNGTGPVSEYGVRMRRMPQDRMMNEVIARGELERRHIDDLATVLADFYQRAASDETILSFGQPDAVAQNVLENFTQMEPFIGKGALDQEQFDQIQAYAKNFLRLEKMFQQRIDAGRICEGHGDLYSANICLADKVHIYDCIEFNQRFRYLDVADDVAFLCMDLEFHGLNDLSQRFIDVFCHLTGDDELRLMLNFYACYRACVRGKIGLFTASDPQVDNISREQCLKDAAQYFQLAQHYARS